MQLFAVKYDSVVGVMSIFLPYIAHPLADKYRFISLLE